MRINFQPVNDKEKTMAELATGFTNADLVAAVNSYVDDTLAVVNSVTDQQLVYVPIDPDANDTFAATEEERNIGWSLAHLVLHVTASAEESAAFSSLLARGVAVGGRLRYEGSWEAVKSKTEIVARLEESRRMCLGYLSTWPDQPDLTTVRILPENSTWAAPNASTHMLLGLSHWENHMEQFKAVKIQAQENVPTA